MNRITVSNLEAVVARINRVMGTPSEPYTRNGDKFTANIGNYHLSGAYGGYALHRMHNDGGGVQTIIGGYSPKRELYEKMHVFLTGVEAEQYAAHEKLMLNAMAQA